MAGANNAQMKAAGYRARDITKARAERGKLSIARMAGMGFRRKEKKASPPAGWRAAADAARARSETAPMPGWSAAMRPRSKPVVTPAPAVSTKAAKPDVKTLRARVAEMQKRVAAAEAKASAPPGKLKLTPGNYTWKKTATGYSASDGRAHLEQTGKSWALVMRDGSRHPLGKKASFDHAEQAMARLGAR